MFFSLDWNSARSILLTLDLYLAAQTLMDVEASIALFSIGLLCENIYIFSLDIYLFILYQKWVLVTKTNISITFKAKM